MPQVQAKRRLVKSPPELWTELSDAAALARHLGEFGEIRITRLEPETKVVWEGDRATGSVELDAAGWGTQVVLTVEVEEATAAAEPEVAELEPAEHEPESPTSESASADEGTEAEPVEDPTEDEPTAALPTPAVEAAEHVPPAPARRRGFFARLFGRDRTEMAIETARETVAGAPPDARPAAPEVEAAADPEPDPTCEAPAEVEAVAEGEPEREAGAEPEQNVEPEPDDAPREAEPDAEPEPDRAAQVLEHVLDQLGQAHHRPFSRA